MDANSLNSVCLNDGSFKIVLILTVGFSVACFLGYITQRCKLSPILGYLLAGFSIGPFSPGFVADLRVSEQLAEIGVILMMFGVGLHFRWRDLVNVKQIAVPGAIVQTFVATVVSTLLIHAVGWPWQAGLIIGLAIGVASTVVLVRVLSDYDLLETSEGLIAIGWLIVEDFFTVVALVLLPTIVFYLNGGDLSIQEVTLAVVWVTVKLIVLAAIAFTVGKNFVRKVLALITETRSSELFTLAVLALTFAIAVGSSYIFGTSIALGAFIAGMMIGQTDVRHQASAHASTIKDAFVVIFFLSVGMLFNPMAIVEHFLIFISVLGVIILIKPLAALVIVKLLGKSNRTAIIIALALAQIGEFSFILAEEANKLGVLPDQGYDIIVACALISIAINPLWFKVLSLWDPPQQLELES